MSRTIGTTTSITRPTNPVTGTVLLETDTKRLLVWDGSSYYIYNRDTISSPTGGVDDLHYPAGLFTNSSANYYITTTPLFHFDSSFVNGFSANEGLHEDAVIYWYDRTNNHWQTREYTVAPAHALLDLNVSNTISSGANQTPAIYSEEATFTFTDAGFPTNPGTEYTAFFVQCEGNEPGLAVSPIAGGSQQKNWIAGEHPNDGTEPHHFGSYLHSLLTENELSTKYANGPALRIGRASSTGIEYWNTNIGGAATATAAAMSTPPTFDDGYTDLPALLGTTTGSAYSITQYTWEIIFFDSALNLTEINTVKDYLQNKYTGLSSSLSATPDLT